MNERLFDKHDPERLIFPPIHFRYVNFHSGPDVMSWMHAVLVKKTAWRFCPVCGHDLLRMKADEDNKRERNSSRW